MLKVMLENREDAIDRMLTHIQDPENSPLSEKDKEIFSRLLELSALRVEHLSKAKTIPIYRRITGVSKSQAYLDWRDMDRIFGDLEKSNANAKRALYTEKLEQWAEKCAARQDFKTAILAIREAAKINRLDQDDPERPPYDEFEMEAPIVGYYPKLADADDISDEDMIKVLKAAVGEHEKEANLRILEFLESSAEDVKYTEDEGPKGSQ